MIRLTRTLLTVCALLIAGAGIARAEAALEYQVKGAMLYNFTRFVTWPPSAQTGAQDVRLCLIGSDPFNASLEGLVGKPAGTGVFSIHRSVGAEVPAGCEVVFIGVLGPGQRAALLTALAARPVLTVGEDADFIRAGGIIQFQIQDGKVRFAVNPDAATRAGLRISAKLLSLAIIVREEQP